MGERFGMMEMVHRLVREAMMPVAMGGWEVGGKDIMKKVSSLCQALISTNLLSLHRSYRHFLLIYLYRN